MTEGWERQSWVDAEPRRAQLEKTAMQAVAPDLIWIEDDLGFGWEGYAPIWPFDRSEPPDLEGFLNGRRFKLLVRYLEGFPMVAPRVWPLDPKPEVLYRAQHTWHLNSNGSLCLMQTDTDWTGHETGADLVVKAAGWFLEYLLMQDGKIQTMTVSGLANDSCHDHLLTSASPPTTEAAGQA